jgi:fructose-bisphosphate aldolase / 2-amino-3,7-dideoxy-D-threo-hept-6-ulosonate synthase
MKKCSFLSQKGRAVVVAMDHPLYSWPCRGLEDRGRLLKQVSEAGADAVIASYGTIRDFRGLFGKAQPILKLDLTSVTLGTNYPLTEYVPAWTLEDAQRLGVGSVLTYVQLGAPFELEALRVAGALAAACDRAGLSYVCEIMPIESAMFPDPAAPDAIAAACRAGAELGAHLIKTTMPVPATAVSEAVRAAGVPVILAGGAFAKDRAGLLADVEKAVANGAAGVAFGRNVWGAEDPGAVVASLCKAVHGEGAKQ